MKGQIHFKLLNILMFMDEEKGKTEATSDLGGWNNIKMKHLIVGKKSFTHSQLLSLCICHRFLLCVCLKSLTLSEAHIQNNYFVVYC